MKFRVDFLNPLEKFGDGSIVIIRSRHQGFVRPENLFALTELVPEPVSNGFQYMLFIEPETGLTPEELGSRLVYHTTTFGKSQQWFAVGRLDTKHAEITSISEKYPHDAVGRLLARALNQDHMRPFCDGSLEYRHSQFLGCCSINQLLARFLPVIVH